MRWQRICDRWSFFLHVSACTGLCPAAASIALCTKTQKRHFHTNQYHTSTESQIQNECARKLQKQLCNGGVHAGP